MGLVKPENIYQTLKRLVEVVGLKSVDPYFSDPAQAPPEGPPRPDPKLIEMQARTQMEQQKLQMQAQADQQRMQQEFALKQQQLEAEMALKREQLQAELQLKREQMAAELTLRREMGLTGARMNLAAGRIELGGEPG